MIWIPILISSISLIFSIWTFFYNKSRNAFKLDFSVLETYSTVSDGAYIKVAIENESANPISVTKFMIANVPSNIKTVRNKLQIGVNWYIVTSTMPVHLNPYEASNIIIYFNVEHSFLNNKNYQHHLFTTRGKKSTFVEAKNKTKDLKTLAFNEGELQ
ncbi:hypothetical protein [Staphylococcus saprophyticus]|uniref:hypothetical protein n=1 Tax=Staphylococcus saprophyticus TaxID=29385 RepID=UPI00118D51B3|nr:hypothetical protein [Staphylococcus saprophyticus]QDX05489.1 hypothetical protein DV527_05295 [Staphylococcus saprophyticus]